MPTPQLHIEPEWRRPLAQAGLDSFDALMAFEGGQVVSWHTRGKAFRVALPDGQVVFLKRDAFTMHKHILADLAHFRRPQPMTFKERRGNRQVGEVGIATPRVIAWGQRRRFGLPTQAVIVSTRLPGRRLDHCLAADDAQPGRREVLTAVGSALARLYEAGLSWPDLVPKHVYVSDDGGVGVLDLARVRRCRNALVRCMPAQVRRFCHRLRQHGAAEADLDVLLQAMGYEDLVDYQEPR